MFAKNGSFFIPLEQGLKPLAEADTSVSDEFFLHSIRTRIKTQRTEYRFQCYPCSFFIPLEQGLKLISGVVSTCLDSSFFIPLEQGLKPNNFGNIS